LKFFVRDQDREFRLPSELIDVPSARRRSRQSDEQRSSERQLIAWQVCNSPRGLKPAKILKRDACLPPSSIATWTGLRLSGTSFSIDASFDTPQVDRSDHRSWVEGGASRSALSTTMSGFIDVGNTNELQDATAACVVPPALV
jgi:hypothetical protein